jgi:hypothetical protein
MTSLSRTLLATALLASAAAAQAVDVTVTVTGTVDYNVIRGDMTGIPAGAPVTMSFAVDSTSFVDSPSWPTRGYKIDPASFTMSVGGAAVTMDNPQPWADAYFVLRNDDPAVDGFFVSQGSVEFPLPLSVHVGGLVPEHELNFSRTFDGKHTLGSLDILDAVGQYGWEDMSSYMWTLGRFGSYGAEYVYDSITISAAVPEPTTWALLAGGLLFVGRRVRTQAR